MPDNPPPAELGTHRDELPYFAGRKAELSALGRNWTPPASTAKKHSTRPSRMACWRKIRQAPSPSASHRSTPTWWNLGDDFAFVPKRLAAVVNGLAHTAAAAEVTTSLLGPVPPSPGNCYGRVVGDVLR